LSLRDRAKCFNREGRQERPQEGKEYRNQDTSQSRTRLTAVTDFRDNASLMSSRRFTFALFQRYWFTGSGRGEARIFGMTL